ncbi:MAG: hypothetical protein JXA71_00675 [Chitinispirillaceae bacterium]|nr:hypothetical protein [Chitinispirillaceae bacterium]
MQTDIRLPIGLLFTIIGAVITIFGLATGGSKIYDEHSLGININIWSGICLTLFGVWMLVMAVRAQKKGKNPVQDKSP